jgi:hypothetical protein
VFFERDTEWYAAHRDLHHLPGGRRIERIWVKSRDAGSHWIWGAMRMPGSVLHDLHRLWCRGDRRDEYLGTLVNAWLASGGTASGVCAGAAYVDVGTLNGYRAALELLQARGESDPPVFAGAQLLAADQWRIAAAAAS